MGRAEVTGTCSENAARDFCNGDEQKDAIITRFGRVGASISATASGAWWCGVAVGVLLDFSGR